MLCSFFFPEWRHVNATCNERHEKHTILTAGSKQYVWATCCIYEDNMGLNSTLRHTHTHTRIYSTLPVLAADLSFPPAEKRGAEHTR